MKTFRVKQHVDKLQNYTFIENTLPVGLNLLTSVVWLIEFCGLIILYTSTRKSNIELIIYLFTLQTWFFTDDDDKIYQEKTSEYLFHKIIHFYSFIILNELSLDGHLINTNCSNGHFRRALCCKMSVELDMFLESSKK